MTVVRGGEERRGWMLVSGKQPARKFHCTEFSHFASAPLMSTVRSHSLPLQVREKPNRVSFDYRSSFVEAETREGDTHSKGIDIPSFLIRACIKT